MNQTHFIFTAIFILLPIITFGQTQNDTVPRPIDTLTALREAVIPPRDPVLLSAELRGQSTTYIAPAEPVEYQLGDTDTFYLTNTSTNTTVTIEAEIRYIGTHIVYWVDSVASPFIDDDDLDYLGQTFDQIIYPQMTALWGKESSPGIDGDPRIHGLFANDIGSGLIAYFSQQNTFPRDIITNSNQREMFVYNLRTIGYDIGQVDIASVTIHEFQHMIRANIIPNMASWLNEGFSVFSENYLGFNRGLSAIQSFLSNPFTQLTDWQGLQANYGGGMLFVSYFFEEFGLEALQTLSQSTARSFYSVEDVALASGDRTGDEVFADWVVANVVQNDTIADGRYGYASIPALARARPITHVTEYPFEVVAMASQFSTHYYDLLSVEAGDTIDITLEAPETVALTGSDAFSGSRMWYSNRADDSMMSLSRHFDLRDIDKATLNYRVWFDTEVLWDYGYVTVSKDNGLTWDVLETPHMTAENPHFTAYGVGYTGESNTWLAESIPLDIYTGHEIIIRFMVINDDATHDDGMLIDDVAIPEIDYFSDFEENNGGWMAEGWVYTDNVLPQTAWVQVIQFNQESVQIDRHLWSENTTISTEIQADMTDIVLAISPIAPETTQPMPYTLDVNRRSP